MNPAEESRKRRNYDAFQLPRDRSISPPPKRYASAVSGRAVGKEATGSGTVNHSVASPPCDRNYESPKLTKEATPTQSKILFASPVQLNFIEELPASSNVDCISLGSILGDPMIKECWLFNYLFDMDFVM